MPEAAVLVFGATGSLGRHFLNGLIDRGNAPGSITAVGRNRSRLGELASTGFDTAAIDLSDSAAVTEVVTGHREVVLISGSDPDRLAQHRGVIDAAKNAGVQHVYYTSGVRADDARFAINADHRATEDALVASGLTYTILRNTWYIENYIRSMALAQRSGILAAATGDAVVAPASRIDLGEALAILVSTAGHDNVTYSLTGDTNFTYADIAKAMSGVLGRDVVYRPLTPDQLRSTLTDLGMDNQLADFLFNLDETIAAGAFARFGDDLPQLLGRATSTLADGLRSE